MEGNTQSVKNVSFLFSIHTIVTGVNCIIGSISQDKQEINASKHIAKIKIKAGITEKFIKFTNK